MNVSSRTIYNWKKGQTTPTKSKEKLNNIWKQHRDVSPVKEIKSRKTKEPPELKYKVTVLRHKPTGEDYIIKWRKHEIFKSQFEFLLNSYNYTADDMQIISEDEKAYKEYKPFANSVR